jgi:hypothetical protein
VVEQAIRRIRTNREWRELYGNLNIIADIKNEETGMVWTCSKSRSWKGS